MTALRGRDDRRVLDTAETWGSMPDGGSLRGIQTYRSDEFGVATSTQGGVTQDLQYAGEQRDESGYVFLRARTYAPARGRFLQRDPMVGVPAVPLSLNRYAYALNNPVSRTDPSGLDVLGSFTHKYIIEPAFIQQHPTYSAEQYYLDPISGKWYFIDLIDWSATPRPVFYEIKPWTEPQAGVQQVTQRAGLGFQAGGPVGDLWINGPFLGSLVHVWWQQAGLLLYEWLFELPPVIPIPYPSPGEEPSRLPGNFPNPYPPPVLVGERLGAQKSAILR